MTQYINFYLLVKDNMHKIFKISKRLSLTYQENTEYHHLDNPSYQISVVLTLFHII